MSRNAAPAAALAAPRALEVETLRVDDEEIIVLSYALPRLTFPAQLTPAEQQIVQHIAAGSSNAEIAAARGTSGRTVANQLANIFRKLKVSGRAELLALLTTQ